MNDYKLFLKHANGTFTDETDYYNVTLDDALDDFCNEHQCKPADVFCRDLNELQQTVCGILCKHNDGTYSLWQGNLTNDEIQTIQGILNKHEVDGYSVRGKYNEIIKESE